MGTSTRTQPRQSSSALQRHDDQDRNGEPGDAGVTLPLGPSFTILFLFHSCDNRVFPHEPRLMSRFAHRRASPGHRLDPAVRIIAARCDVHHAGRHNKRRQFRAVLGGGCRRADLTPRAGFRHARRARRGSHAAQRHPRQALARSPGTHPASSPPLSPRRTKECSFERRSRAVRVAFVIASTAQIKSNRPRESSSRRTTAHSRSCQTCARKGPRPAELRRQGGCTCPQENSSFWTARYCISPSAG